MTGLKGAIASRPAMICATVPFGNVGSEPQARTSAAAGGGVAVTVRAVARRPVTVPAVAGLALPGLALAGLAGPAVAVQAVASVMTARLDTATAGRIPRIVKVSHLLLLNQRSYYF